MQLLLLLLHTHQVANWQGRQVGPHQRELSARLLGPWSGVLPCCSSTPWRRCAELCCCCSLPPTGQQAPSLTVETFGLMCGIY